MIPLFFVCVAYDCDTSLARIIDQQILYVPTTYKEILKHFLHYVSLLD